MKRRALEKDFDKAEVQSMGLDIGRFWSDEAYEQ